MGSIREIPNLADQDVKDSVKEVKDRFLGQIESIANFVSGYESEYAEGLINLQSQQEQEEFASKWGATKAHIKAKLLEEKKAWQDFAESKNLVIELPLQNQPLVEKNFNKSFVMKVCKEATDAFFAMKKMNTPSYYVPKTAEFLEKMNEELVLQIPRIVNCMDVLSEAVEKYSTDAERALQQKPPQTKIERQKSASKASAAEVTKLIEAMKEQRHY